MYTLEISGMAIALFAILLAVGCLVARFCVFRVDQIGELFFYQKVFLISDGAF